MNRLTGFRLILFTMLLTACGMSEKATATPTPSATPPFLADTSQSIQPSSTLTSPGPISAVTADDPMHFVLPTAGVEPVSAWRPPLYPIPWALSPYDHFYFARPIAADQINWPLGDYRYGNTYFGPDIVHTGIDIPAPEGTPVLAAGPGTVISAGWGLVSNVINNKKNPYGQAVVIRHDFGYKGQPLYTIYAHLLEIDVATGQWLDTGDVLGKVGQTGLTTGPHLHFEVRIDAEDFFSTRNPELWLAPPQGWGVLVGRVMNTYKNPLSNYDVYIHSVETDQIWIVKTYALTTINSDSYYNENLVLSDLPAGPYIISIPYGGGGNKIELQILAGQATYFTFQGYQGFNTEPPSSSEPDSFSSPIP